MSQKKLRRILQVMGIVTALMMVLCFSAFASDGGNTTEPAAADTTSTTDTEEPAALEGDGSEELEAVEGTEEGIEEPAADEAEEPAVDAEEPAADAEEPAAEVDEPAPVEPVVTTTKVKVPPTADAGASLLPYVVGFAVIGGAVVALRRRATK